MFVRNLKFLFNQLCPVNELNSLFKPLSSNELECSVNRAPRLIHSVFAAEDTDRIKAVPETLPLWFSARRLGGEPPCNQDAASVKTKVKQAQL